MSEIDTYKTILKPSEEILFKEKGSKFIGIAFPVSDENEVKLMLEKLKKNHFTANHICYGYQIGTSQKRFRVSDDGEPNNSAGLPIYGQIQAFEVTNILVVSVRYFGGTKLGVGGLISAYKTSAKLALEASEIIEKTIDEFFKIQFPYDLMSKIMRIMKENNMQLISQKMEINCELIVSVRKNESEKVFQIFNETYQVVIKKLES